MNDVTDPDLARAAYDAYPDIAPFSDVPVAPESHASERFAFKAGAQWAAARIRETDAQIAEEETPWSIMGHPDFDQRRVMDTSVSTERARIAAEIRAAGSRKAAQS